MRHHVENTRRLVAAAIAAGSLALASLIAISTPAAAGTPPIGSGQGGVAAQLVHGGFSAPIYAATAPGQPNLLYVVERGGTVRVLNNGVLQGAAFLDISGLVSTAGEGGLLSIAFDPSFATNGLFYAYYSNGSGNIEIDEFDTVSATDADESSRRRVITVLHPTFSNHFGGTIHFGRDGYLYAATGDGGGSGDPGENAQNKNSLLGKLLRIDPHGALPGEYTIPSDNPFVGVTGADEVYARGLRNPFRWSFDPVNGRIAIGDVGQSAWEEVDVARAGTSGENYGWNTMEGNHCFNPSSGCSMTGLTLPLAEYGHDAGCTVIGGNVYRGSAQPALTGGYFFGDYCSGTIWAIDPGSDALRAPTVVLKGSASLSSFGEDEAGELYATDIGGGNLLRITGQR